MKVSLKYVVIIGMVLIATLGLPILFPYNKRPHADKGDHSKSSLLVNA